jgi:hypothetical protein
MMKKVFQENNNNNNMEISIVTIFRDEAKYLKEWIEFHKLVGVDKFYLVNNNSKDNYMEILQPYINSGVVELSNIDVETNNNPNGVENEIIIATHFVRELNKIVKTSPEDWIIHVSTDEFIYPTTSDNIKDVLKNYNENVGEVLVNWVLFGNNKHYLKDDELLIEKLTKASQPNHVENLHVKFIVRPTSVLYVPSVHHTILKPGFIKVDALGNPNNFKLEYMTSTWVGNPLRINHYRLRDLSWTDKKLRIYELWGRHGFNDLIDKYNDVDDFTIQRFTDKLKLILN